MSEFTLVGKFRDDISGPIRAAKQEVAALGTMSNESFRGAAAAVQSLSEGLQNQIIKLQAEKSLLSDPVYRKRTQEAADLKREIAGLTEKVGDSNKSASASSELWQSVASKYYLVSQAAGYASRAIGSVVEAASKYELLHARLNAVEGSTALGNQDFKEVQELAKKPGLGFEEAASTFATLRGMKVTAAETKTLINGIAQANASAAGTAEQFGRVMYQIQQSVSLGRLMAEDLRPIQQAIPTLGAAMQAHFGSNQAEQLNEILAKSGKSVREFWLEVAELGTKLPSTGETIANNLDNMKDAWVRFRASLADSDAIRSVTGALTSLLEALAKANEMATERKELRVRAEASTGKRTINYAPAGIDLDGLQGGSDEAIIQAEMQRIRWQDAVKTMNEQYDKEEKEAADRRIADRKARVDKETTEAAKDAKKAFESEQKRLEAHRRASLHNVDFTGPNEVTMRGAMSMGADGKISGGDQGERAKGLERLEAGREKREKSDLAEAQKLKANAQKIRMDWESAFLEKKKQAHEEEMKLIRERFDVGQKLASDQLYKAMQGEFTMRGAYEATKDVIFRTIADTTTKLIEEQLIRMAFARATQAAETTASVAQATVVGAAWTAPSMATSIATFGGSTAAGSASWFAAMTSAQGYSMMPHARGGAVFGAYMGSREERLDAFLPGRVVPSYNSTTNHSTTNAQKITINVHGSDERTILRTLRKAGINGAGVSHS